jgi:hypothetical protein
MAGRKKICSKFHEEGFVAFSDTIPLLAPQDSRLYELPTPEDKSYIFTATVICRYGTGDRARFLTIGNSSDPASDQIAFRHVEEGRSVAMQRLESRGRADSSTGSRTNPAWDATYRHAMDVEPRFGSR